MSSSGKGPPRSVFICLHCRCTWPESPPQEPVFVCSRCGCEFTLKAAVGGKLIKTGIAACPDCRQYASIRSMGGCPECHRGPVVETEGLTCPNCGEFFLKTEEMLEHMEEHAGLQFG